MHEFYENDNGSTEGKDEGYESLTALSHRVNYICRFCHLDKKKKKKTTLKLFNNQNARRVGIKYSDRQDEFMNKYERRLMDNKR